MNRSVRVGGPIALMVLGAIIYFALSVKEYEGFNIALIGAILGIAGLCWLVIELVMNSRKGEVNSSIRTETANPDAPGGVEVSRRDSTVEER